MDTRPSNDLLVICLEVLNNEGTLNEGNGSLLLLLGLKNDAKLFVLPKMIANPKINKGIKRLNNLFFDGMCFHPVDSQYG
ncbi:MAG: hypothetical protein ACYCQI_08105 [Gammaproteobacteria bacterium]